MAVACDNKRDHDTVIEMVRIRTRPRIAPWCPFHVEPLPDGALGHVPLAAWVRTGHIHADSPAGLSEAPFHDLDDDVLWNPAMTLPSLFISHGAPDVVLQDLPATRAWVDLAQRLPRPRAIVVVSAHWTTREAAVEIGDQPVTVHDFAGFAPELFQIRYPAPGDPVLAQRMVGMLDGAGLVAGGADHGFDHGVWVPLALMYPEADIPVVVVSVQPRQDGLHHVRVGQALAPLRQEDVLIIGSGAMTHNLGALLPGSTEPPAWVTAFDDWVTAAAEAGDLPTLADWQRLGPSARLNHPSPEHFVPLLVAAGAGGGPGRLLHRSTTWGVLQMTMLAFGDET